MPSTDLGLGRWPAGSVVTVDGLAWLRELQQQPGKPVLLEPDQALAIAQSLAAAQALVAGQQRMDFEIGRLASRP